MDPNIWGPHLWHYMHMISFNHPNNPNSEDVYHQKVFLENLQHTLPCNKCKMHYKQYISKYPPKLNTKMDYIKWVIDLHNAVNERNGKKIYNYDEAIEEIRNNFSDSKQDDSKCPNYFKYLCIVLFIISIVFIVLYFKKMNIKKRKVIRY